MQNHRGTKSNRRIETMNMIRPEGLSPIPASVWEEGKGLILACRQERAKSGDSDEYEESLTTLKAFELKHNFSLGHVNAMEAELNAAR